ncbi:MAG: glycosyltransferase [Abditibacteriota bacterium]|nr:glycosyltransferase [Abditibacteriota bacterium]
MNIVIFSESCFPVINGVSASTGILSEGLRRLGHKVTVVAPRHKAAGKEEGVVRTSSFVSGFAKDYPIPSPSCFREADGIIGSLAPDIVHVQIPFVYGVAARRAARRRGIPFVSVSHTLYPEYVHYVPFLPRRICSAAVKKYMARFYDSCDAVAVPSEMMKRELEGYGVKKALKVIPTGIDLPREAPSARLRETLGIPAGAEVLVYMSRVAKEKNLDMLMDAFRLAAEGRPELFLLITGGGPYLETLKRSAAASPFSRRIVFTGMVQKNRIYDYLGCGDVFVFPSVTETQGLAVCEAQAAGLPVVAVRAGGVPENIDENVTGLLTENDKNAFAAAVLRLLENRELREKMGAEAAKKAAGFSVGAMLKKYEAFYAFAAGGKNER